MPGFGNACHFTDSSRPITVAGVNLDPYCGSLEAWIRPEVPEAGEDAIGATILRIPAPGGRHILSLEYSGSSVCVWYEVLNFTLMSSGTYPTKEWCGRWHHILTTYDTTSRTHADLKLFVDGELRGRDCPERPVARIECAGADVFIGSYVEGFCSKRFPGNFRGDIDEVRISRGLREPPDLDQSKAKPCKADGNTILLLNFNETDGAVSVMDSVSNQSVIYEHRCRLPGIWEDHGSLDAVYDFLERFYRVRWYAPTESGIVYDPQPTMKVPTTTGDNWVEVPEEREAHILRRRPAMVQRDIYTPQLAGTEKYPKRKTDWFMVGPPEEPETLIPNMDRWVWMLRMRMGGTPLAMGHSLPGGCVRYLDRYPACFAHNQEEEVTPASILPGVPQMCYTHDALIEALANDACSHFKDKPVQRLTCYARSQGVCRECDPNEDRPRLGGNHSPDSYSLSPADNGNWCQCHSCEEERKFVTIPPPPEGLFANDRASYYIHNFTRRVAQKIRDVHPEWVGQKWLGQTAYADHAHYPRWPAAMNPEELDPLDVEDAGDGLRTFKEIEPNVFTWLCLHSRTLWDKQVQDNDKVILNDWRQHVPGERLGAYLYYLYPAFWTETQTPSFRCFPGFCASEVVRLFKETKEAAGKYTGFREMAGVHIEMQAEFVSFLMDQLELYLTFKLADDPEQSGDKIIEEFFCRYYGPAAQAMGRLYHDIEHVFTTTLLPRNPTEELTWGLSGLGNPERMVGYLKLMADAVAATRRAQEHPGTVRTPGGFTDALTANRPTQEPAIYAARVDLFRRGVWNYMLEGYCNYWAKQVGSLPLPLLRLSVRPVDKDRCKGLGDVLKAVPWAEVFHPFSYGQEFGEPLLQLPISSSPWHVTWQYTGVVILVDPREESLCAAAHRVAVWISAHVAPSQVVEVQHTDTDLSPYTVPHPDWGVGKNPAIVIAEWSRGF